MQQQVQRSPIPGGLQQMSPLSLVTHGAQQSAHHRMMGGPSIGQMPNMVSHEIEQRMMEYIKLLQNSKEPQRKYRAHCPFSTGLGLGSNGF